MKTITNTLSLLALLGFGLGGWAITKGRKAVTYIDDLIAAVAGVAVIKHFWPKRKRDAVRAGSNALDLIGWLGCLLALIILLKVSSLSWKAGAVSYGGWWAWRIDRRRIQALGGEPDTDDGKRRAEQNRSVTAAIGSTLRALVAAEGDSGNTRLDLLGSGRATIDRGGKVTEIGWWVDIRFAGRLTLDQLRARGGQVFARSADTITATANDLMLWPKKTGRRPEFIASNVAAHRRGDGQEVPGRARITLLTQDPFARACPMPYGVRQRYAANWLTDGVPLGVRFGGAQVSLRIWHQHNLASGKTRYGKSSALHVVLYGLATEEHVAFILIDLKGTDLPPWAARASCVVTDERIVDVVLAAVYAELRHRRDQLAAAGQIKLQRPTADMPALIVVIDEAQNAVEGESVTAEQAITNTAWYKRLAKEAASFGIELVMASQFVKANLFDTAITTQLTKISAHQPNQSAAGVAVGQNVATKTFGPHLIPADQRRYAGVLAGSWEGIGEEYVRVYALADDGSAARARAKATAHLRVELPWLTAALAGASAAAPITATAPSGDIESDSAVADDGRTERWHKFRRRPVIVADLPAPIATALAELAVILDVSLAGTMTAPEVRKLATRAVRKTTEPAYDDCGDRIRAAQDVVDTYLAAGTVPASA